jgi:hypothetical protein
MRSSSVSAAGAAGASALQMAAVITSEKNRTDRARIDHLLALRCSMVRERVARDSSAVRAATSDPDRAAG